MGLIASLRGQTPRKVRAQAGYTGANQDRLTASWLTSNKTADELLRMQLKTLRSRSRDLARNNDYVRKFFRLLRDNVIGPRGIQLQNQARHPDGRLDMNINKLVEDSFRAWGRKGVPTLCGRLSWRGLQDLVIESVARDGEALLYEMKGAKVNAHGYALQVLEADLLNEDYNRKLPNGNQIHMGIELTQAGRPVAYHLLTNHPGETGYVWAGRKYRVIPAEDMIHIYSQERPTQSRGVPWIHTAIVRLQMLGGYEEAELVSSRVSSAKMGWFTREEGAEGFSGDSAAETDIEMEAEPGTFGQLPPGVNFQPWDPQHPTTAFADFIKAVLRGASAGMGPGYNTLSNNLENVNYSSLRQGALEERDHYSNIQQWFIEDLHERVYDSWLPMSMLTGATPIPYGRLGAVNVPKFQPRGWDWVDPLKEVNADIKAIEAGITSRRRVLAKRGYDFEEIIDELAAEAEYAAEKKVSLAALPGAANKGVNKT